jgi:hypothetical protein
MRKRMKQPSTLPTTSAVRDATSRHADGILSGALIAYTAHSARARVRLDSVSQRSYSIPYFGHPFFVEWYCMSCTAIPKVS